MDLQEYVHDINVRLHLCLLVQGESYEKAASALAQVVVQPEWRISADAAGPQPQDKKKPHNDVEAIIAQATKQRRKLLYVESSSDDEDEDEESDDEGDEKEQKEAAADDAEPKVKKAKKEPKKPKAKEEEPAAPLVSGIEEAGMHIVLKKILKNDGKREGTPFSQQLLQNLSSDVVSTQKSCHPVTEGIFLFPSHEKRIVLLSFFFYLMTFRHSFSFSLINK